MFKIQIPKPCHEDWSAMTPTQQGAFCGSCSKEVVDFTKMTDQEVQSYFLNRTTEKTCGHFRTDQIHRIRIEIPDTVLLQKISGWKRFMAIILLAFGSMLFGCDVQQIPHDRIVGELEMIQPAELLGDTVLPNQKTDTAHCNINSITMGTPAVITGDYIVPINDTPQILPTVDGMIELDTIGTVNTPHTSGYNEISTGKVLLEKKDTTTKKPAPDTSKCKDTGFF